MELKQTNIRIIQTSYPHTGSTVLVNLLQGFFYPADAVYSGNITKNTAEWIQACLEKNCFIVKTHTTDICSMIEALHEYELYFITSSRNEKRISNHPRLLNIEYEELLETPSNTLETIANNVGLKIKEKFPIFSNYINLASGHQRVRSMNEKYEEIKHFPFSYYDKFYHINGSHRNRTQ